MCPSEQLRGCEFYREGVVPALPSDFGDAHGPRSAREHLETVEQSFWRVVPHIPHTAKIASDPARSSLIR